MPFDVAGRTHVGLKRSENQDQVFAQVHASGGRQVACMAVADGMGGHEKGREASQTAIDAFRNGLEKCFQGEGVRPSEQWCVEIEQEAHQLVRRIANSEEVVGTTLTVALLTDSECLIGHVGDSRVYCYRNGKLDRITEDQTWEAYALKNQVENTYGNALRQAIGVGDRVFPETYRVELLPDDWILLCSDGLYKMVDDAKVEKALSQSDCAEDACGRLVTLALDGGGRDNVGVCVARFGEPPVRPKRVNPALIASYVAVLIVVILLALAVTGKV